MSGKDQQVTHSDYLFKIVLVGDSGVGKSSILLRFADDTFSQSYISTIGVDFRFKTLQVDSKIAKLQIWDTAGQERFKTITSAYYRGADGVFLVFDKTSLSSFQHISTWLEQINRCSESSCRVLVGNKYDMQAFAEVDEVTARNFADQNGMLYIETSALNSHQVVAAFEAMTRDLMNKKQKPVPKGNKLSPFSNKKALECCSS